MAYTKQNDPQWIQEYLAFLSEAKEERETIRSAAALAEGVGFVKLDAEVQDRFPAGGNRPFYVVNRGKSMILAVPGTRPLREGLSIILAHVDSPHLDLKPVPLYEREGSVYLDTHYYGSIKKYQWVTVPLALHGTVVKEDGSTLHLTLGEQKGEPRFVITDLPPHISARQMEHKAADFISGERLDALAGSRQERVLQALADLGISTEDFPSSELKLVPALKPSLLGFDESLIGGYGQDDRSLVFASLSALTALVREGKQPTYTALLILTDKEETGSNGPTGVQSSWFRDFVEGLCRLEAGGRREENAAAAGGGVTGNGRADRYGKGYDSSTAAAATALANSFALSADVISTFDPNWPEEDEPRNMARLSRGVVASKYRGFHGKADTQDASAELVAMVRRLFHAREIPWQTGEAGYVDAGGGKTAGRFLAVNNLDVLDVGIPILSMHSPYEVISVDDLQSARAAYRAFFERDFSYHST